VVQDRALEAEADRLGQRAATHRVAVQANMPPGTAQLSALVRISPLVSAGPGSYRLSAGTGGREVDSIMVHVRERGAVEVTDLGVDAGQRGHGMGQMLVAVAARTGLQSGRSKVTLAAQDNGSGHLTQWYKGMGFAQVGVNQRGYPQLEAPISRVLAGTVQRREKQLSSSDSGQPRGELSGGFGIAGAPIVQQVRPATIQRMNSSSTEGEKKTKKSNLSQYAVTVEIPKRQPVCEQKKGPDKIDITSISQESLKVKWLR
jgi:ribosomal protein S18 acetylase RimI-like enzyme